MEYKVSIIVPVYMVENYLDNCISSILNQEYNDFEVIVVDDGSSDDCGMICDESSLLSSNITVIHQKNGGLSAARNSALGIARGDYIVFVDGDDEIFHNHLSTVVPYMESGAELVSFRYAGYNKEGIIEHYAGSSSQKQEFTLDNDTERADFIIQKLLTYSIGWESCTRVFSKSFIEKYRIKYEDNNKIYAEDMYFSICYCTHVHKLVVLPDVLYKVNLRETSITHTSGLKLNVGRMNELSKAVHRYLTLWNDCGAILKAFPAIHLLILNDAFYKAQVRKKPIMQRASMQEYRVELLNDIFDLDFFEKTTKKAVKQKKKLVNALEREYLNYYIAFCRYLLDGLYFKFWLYNFVSAHIPL